MKTPYKVTPEKAGVFEQDRASLIRMGGGLRLLAQDAL